MTQNAKILFELIKNNLDSIWPYILRNMYRPISLTYKKVDLVIGNPPWIAQSKMKNKDYQQFLKNKSKEYDLVDPKKAHNIANMELATLFFCHCVDKYLKKNGTIAFVMTKAVLIASQHVKFLEFISTSAKTGVAPITDIELASAECEKLGTITSSPIPMPKLFIPAITAEVAFENATA